MTMNSLLSIGAAGARTAMDTLDRSAARVARAGAMASPVTSPVADPAAAAPAATRPVDLAADLSAEAVTQIQARHAFTANLQTVKTADRLLGTLIDTFA